MTEKFFNLRPPLFLGLIVVLLNACTGLEAGAGAGALMYITKPGDPAPADTADQIAEHENWCYQTLGNVECYSHPQNVDPDRLVNVDPQNRYPLTRRAYHETVIEDQ